jgi:hypothetical protein
LDEHGAAGGSETGREEEVNSDLSGIWSFTPENGAKTTITVPGGGWLKQGFACEAGAYETRIAIPDGGRPQATRLELGAVNHHATYYLGVDEHALRKIHEEVTAFTPQVVDLTPHVRPGQSYLLRIAVRAWKNGRPVAPHWAEWCECIARGLFRDAWLRVYPDIFLDDVFVRTSVARHTLDADIRIVNASARERKIRISGTLASCNGDTWPYPAVPEMDVVLGAGATTTVKMGPIDWSCGPQGFWWPNVPYREGYRAKLHLLNLTLAERGTPLHTKTTRFGFRELRQSGNHFELNGTRINFRGDNLQVANYDRIDHGGKGDAIDTLPGFLPPSAGNPGWPKAVDNFLRLNYNVQREHMGPWSPYMLDVCDEMGLMLIGESACRWNGFDMNDGVGFHEVKCLQDIVRRDRNHPSIVRWSSKNEAQNKDPRYHVELYDAIRALDNTRPIFEDFLTGDRVNFNPLEIFAPLLNKPDFTWIEHYLTHDEKGGVYFTPLQHNDALVPLRDRPYGIGEADWMRGSTPAGLAWWATSIALYRAAGASDARPYTLLSSWASCIPGVKNTDFLTEENRHPLYGANNLPEPWNHPGIRLLQKACHPLLAIDVAFWRMNRKTDAFGHFPVCAPELPASTAIERTLLVFNDELAGRDLLLRWEIREGHPANQLWDRGMCALSIEPGFSAPATIRFETPKFNTQFFVKLIVEKDGALRFEEELLYYEVTGGMDFRSEFNGEERKFL